MPIAGWPTPPVRLLLALALSACCDKIPPGTYVTVEPATATVAAGGTVAVTCKAIEYTKSEGLCDESGTFYPTSTWSLNGGRCFPAAGCTWTAPVVPGVYQIICASNGVSAASTVTVAGDIVPWTGTVRPVGGTPTAAAVSADGSRVLVGTSAGQVTLWPLDGAAPLWSVPRGAHIGAVAMAPGGGEVLAAALGSGVATLSGSDGSEIAVTSFPPGLVMLALDADGQGRAVGFGSGGTLYAWPRAGGPLLGSFQLGSGQYETAGDVAFSTAGDSVAVAAGSGGLWVMETGSWTATLKRPVEGGVATGVAWGTDPTSLFVATSAGTILYRNGEEASRHASPTHDLALSPGGSLLAAATDAGLLLLDPYLGHPYAALPPSVALRQVFWRTENRPLGLGTDTLLAWSFPTSPQ